MAVRIGDLPKEVQDKIRDGHPEPEKKARDRRAIGGAQHTVCQTCGNEEPTFPKAERHARANPGHIDQRITLVAR